MGGGGLIFLCLVKDVIVPWVIQEETTRFVTDKNSPGILTPWHSSAYPGFMAA